MEVWRTLHKVQHLEPGDHTSRSTTQLFSLSAIVDANQVNQLPHLLQADQVSYHPERNSSSNVKTGTAASYTFQSV